MVKRSFDISTENLRRIAEHKKITSTAGKDIVNEALDDFFIRKGRP